ncbi:MAG: flagellar hook assembly protein FlgD [Paraburkholderia sp.]|uniref:flagellar hook assembly protein FlgD n=1 Tax=Paraburkholderia sp. TaxID=1926495 RepID=UPI0011F50A3E|nr:flagellar hook assembly protein FlgD [Paraburkholderia sp.]TAM05217.1 MAG: flagellar hook assembly protein FlgD [Paraburkholderia sp.]TAM28532.1 MAG: flagellar hook assembly protein FlgD [Paraburkholderia sp.]
MTSSTTIGGSSATVSPQLLDTMNGTSASSASSASSSTSASNLQTTFLQLLVAQLKNQDPTNPMDSSQMTSQLAQINTVSGISQLNTSLSSLSTQLSAGQNAQAALLIGSSVLAPSNTVTVSGGTVPQLGVSVPAAASDVKITVSDASGKIVGSIDLGPQAAGTVPVTWKAADASGNTLADGTYNITATSTINGNQGTATALVASQVQAVMQQADGTPSVSLANGKTVPLTSVAGIL